MKPEIIHIDAVDSTNNQILRLIEDGKCREGMVVWADEQIAGRGYADNQWESEKGKNLTFSLALKPRFIKPASQFLITRIISVALLKLLNDKMASEKIRIKWPNDIYVEAKKIGGILIQNIIKGNSIDFSVVGIGLNVNQEKFISNAPNPVSMKLIANQTFDTRVILDQLLIEIQYQYSLSVSVLGIEKIEKLYLNNLYRYNEWHKFVKDGNTFKGKITGIGEYGHLQVTGVDEINRHFDFKEVEFLL